MRAIPQLNAGQRRCLEGLDKDSARLVNCLLKMLDGLESGQERFVHSDLTKFMQAAGRIHRRRNAVRRLLKDLRNRR